MTRTRSGARLHTENASFGRVRMSDYLDHRRCQMCNKFIDDSKPINTKYCGKLCNVHASRLRHGLMDCAEACWRYGAKRGYELWRSARDGGA